MGRRWDALVRRLPHPIRKPKRQPPRLTEEERKGLRWIRSTTIYSGGREPGVLLRGWWWMYEVEYRNRSHTMSEWLGPYTSRFNANIEAAAFLVVQIARDAATITLEPPDPEEGK